jgi:hypothetical protein
MESTLVHLIIMLSLRLAFGYVINVFDVVIIIIVIIIIPVFIIILCNASAANALSWDNDIITSETV